MASRYDAELWVALTDPDKARDYISGFDWDLPPAMRPNWIFLENDRQVFFSEMTDEDAVKVATIILRDVEVPRVMRQKQFERWEH